MPQWIKYGDIYVKTEEPFWYNPEAKTFSLGFKCFICKHNDTCPALSKEYIVDCSGFTLYEMKLRMAPWLYTPVSEEDFLYNYAIDLTRGDKGYHMVCNMTI